MEIIKKGINALIKISGENVKLIAPNIGLPEEYFAGTTVTELLQSCREGHAYAAGAACDADGDLICFECLPTLADQSGWGTRLINDGCHSIERNQQTFAAIETAQQLLAGNVCDADPLGNYKLVVINAAGCAEIVEVEPLEPLFGSNLLLCGVIDRNEQSYCATCAEETCAFAPDPNAAVESAGHATVREFLTRLSACEETGSDEVAACIAGLTELAENHESESVRNDAGLALRLVREALEEEAAAGAETESDKPAWEENSCIELFNDGVIQPCKTCGNCPAPV